MICVFGALRIQSEGWASVSLQSWTIWVWIQILFIWTSLTVHISVGCELFLSVTELWTSTLPISFFKSITDGMTSGIKFQNKSLVEEWYVRTLVSVAWTWILSCTCVYPIWPCPLMSEWWCHDMRGLRTGSKLDFWEFLDYVWAEWDILHIQTYQWRLF